MVETSERTGRRRGAAAKTAARRLKILHSLVRRFSGTSILIAALVASMMICTSPQRGHAASKNVGRKAEPALPCGNPFAFEVLLDQQNFSPGEIDEKLGSNASRALAAFQAARGLEPSGAVDCDTWRALGGDTAGAITATYVVDEDDVKARLTKTIPRDLERQASLPALGYRSVL